jgi:16S rRNA processing protein RimM
MSYEKHILLGKITRVHSFNGAVTIKLERNFSEKIPELESVFIETDGRPVPFFVKYSEQPDNITMRMQFSGYESDIKVKEFVGSSVYLTGDTIITQPEDMDYLINYKVLSGENEVIGSVIELIEQPGHLLLNIKTVKGKELLLPLHEDLIINIDKKKKIIVMIIPEGIDEIN